MRDDLLPLMALPGVTARRARALAVAGMDSVEKIAACSPEALQRALMASMQFTLDGASGHAAPGLAAGGASEHAHALLAAVAMIAEARRVTAEREVSAKEVEAAVAAEAEAAAEAAAGYGPATAAGASIGVKRPRPED